MRQNKTVVKFTIAQIVIVLLVTITAPAQTLTGDKAVAELKKNGQYDSLIDAVKAVRKANWQAERYSVGAIGQTAKLTAYDGAFGDQFGYGVSISGDTVVVGAFYDRVGSNTAQGSAYIFTRTAGVWTLQQHLIASDGAAGDCFGQSVSISGDTVIIGAYFDDIGVNLSQGSAYVFTRTADVWTQRQKLIASDGTSSDHFAQSVSISGNNIIIGAPNDRVGSNTAQGSAYVFTRSSDVWTQQQKLIASDGAAGDYFGWGVSISGDTVVVGAHRDRVGVSVGLGSAYIFMRTASVWTQQQKLTASDDTAADAFGYSVSISGDTVVIGIINQDVGANENQGSASVFTRTAGFWTLQQKLIASDGAALDGFGRSVSISGESIVISAVQDDVGANADQGSAYVFKRSGGVWAQQQHLIASDGAESDFFGWSVAVSGDTVVVGSYNNDVGANSAQGSAYIFINNVVPTASVSGRILTADGIGVVNAIVTATLANGGVITTRSSSFGYYNFDELETGQTIVISVSSKRYSFDSQVVSLSGNIDELNFTAKILVYEQAECISGRKEENGVRLCSGAIFSQFSILD